MAWTQEKIEATLESFRIGIIDQNDVDIVITLPKVQSDELSDADLEQVAGGKGQEKGCSECIKQTENMADKNFGDFFGGLGMIIVAPVVFLTSQVM